MGIDNLAVVLGAIASLLGGGLASTELIRKLLRRALGKPEPSRTHSERLSELTASLTTASAEVDSILRELSTVAREKEKSVKQLEVGLSSLQEKEQALKDKISALENTPLPVAEHFAKLVESGEKRSATRDYVLFGAGVVVTAVVTIIIQVIS
jgi:chromosome segregation ATPase